MGAPEAFTATADVGHFIGGRTVASQQRTPPGGLQPGDRRRSRARSRWPRSTRSTPRSPPRSAAFPAWADTPPLRRARVMNKFLELLNAAPRHARRDDHRRARQGLHRRAGRGHARHRHRRVRLRHPAAAEGRLHRPGLDRHRQLDAAPAARRRRRHHAVQLSVHGADVDVPGRDRLRQQLHPEAERARPVAVAADGRAAEAGRPAGRRVQRRAGRQGRGRRAARRTPT